MKILLLEDDQVLATSIEELLKLENHEIIKTTNSLEAEEYIIEEEFDLLLLDINVEGSINGFQLAEELRESNDKTNIIFISALSDIQSLKRGYDIGIIDYIKKPFDPLELLYKLKTLENKKIVAKIIKYKNIKYDISKQEIKIGEEIKVLSKIEKLIFDELIQNIGETVSKEILKEILETNNDVSIRVIITKLKQKLKIDIKNIRGIGYQIEKR